MRIITVLLLIMSWSCQSTTQNLNEAEAPDTVLIKIGDLHPEATPKSKMLIDVKIFGDNNRLTRRLYSDSTYHVMVQHGSGLELDMYAISDNVRIEKTDSTYLLQTAELDSGEFEKVEIGFRTDMTKNILIYHHMFIDSEDSTRTIDQKTLIDMVASRQYGLIGRTKNSR